MYVCGWKLIFIFFSHGYFRVVYSQEKLFAADYNTRTLSRRFEWVAHKKSNTISKECVYSYNKLNVFLRCLLKDLANNDIKRTSYIISNSTVVNTSFLFRVCWEISEISTSMWASYRSTSYSLVITFAFENHPLNPYETYWHEFPTEKEFQLTTIDPQRGVFHRFVGIHQDIVVWELLKVCFESLKSIC